MLKTQNKIGKLVIFSSNEDKENINIINLKYLLICVGTSGGTGSTNKLFST
jgi:hypothetical protein